MTNMFFIPECTCLAPTTMSNRVLDSTTNRNHFSNERRTTALNEFRHWIMNTKNSYAIHMNVQTRKTVSSLRRMWIRTLASTESVPNWSDENVTPARDS